MMHPTHNAIGEWIAVRWRMRSAKVGPGAAAAQLRKQGVPLPVALAILLGKMPAEDDPPCKVWRD